MMLTDEVFVKYIEVLTISNFAISFNEGQNAVFSNRLLLNRKIRYVAAPHSEEIRKFDDVDVKIVFDGNALVREKRFQQAAMWMFNYYFNECFQKEDYGRILPILSLASDYFHVFSTKESIANEFIEKVYWCNQNFSELNENHLEEFKNILSNIIKELENSNHDIWGNDLLKCKILFNSIQKDYHTDWISFVID